MENHKGGTIEIKRIKEALSDMAGAKINADNSLIIVQRFNSIGFFDQVFGVSRSCTDERPCINCFSDNGECLVKVED